MGAFAFHFMSNLILVIFEGPLFHFIEVGTDNILLRWGKCTLISCLVLSVCGAPRPETSDKIFV